MFHRQGALSSNDPCNKGFDHDNYDSDEEREQAHDMFVDDL
jgi:hypothetical protein